MQNGETAKVRYETAPKKGTLMNDCAVLLNHLKIYGTTFQEMKAKLHISSLRFRYKTNMYKHHVIIQNLKTNIQIL